MEKAQEQQQPLYMCFVDFKKAFDAVPHDTLWITMLDMGFPAHLVNLIMHLYKRHKVTVKTASVVSGFRMVFCYERSATRLHVVATFIQYTA